jgi:FkbM family methyltransferase
MAGHPPVLYSSHSYYIHRLRDGKQIIFLTPNTGVELRAKTVMSKETETIPWLESMTEEDCLWDIGANIGVYSLYAAIMTGARVYGFEPYLANCMLCNEHAALNGVDARVRTFPVAVAGSSGLTGLKVSQYNTPGVAGPHSQLKGSSAKLQQGIMKLTLSQIKKLGVKSPTHIKLDVDGIEHEIIMAGLDLIAEAKSILFEFPRADKDKLEEIDTALRDRGFEFVTNSIIARGEEGKPEPAKPRQDDNYIYTKPE